MVQNNSTPGCAVPQTLQDDLIRGLYEGEGLMGLTSRLADFIRGGACIIDLTGTLLSDAYCSGCTAEEQKRLRQYVRVRYGAERRSVTALAQLSEAGDSGMFEIAVPLGYAGRSAGTLLAVRSDAPFTEDECQLAGQVSGLFNIQLAQDEKLAEIELRLKGNFVEDLISSHFSDTESILNRARALSYNISVGHRVLVATIDNQEQLIGHAGDTPDGTKRKAELVGAIQSRLDKTAKGMVITLKDELVILVQQKKAGTDMADIRSLAENIIEDAAQSFKAKLYVGIGSACLTLGDFSKSYLEAKKALEIGAYMITEGQVRSFEQFKVHALFLSTLKPAELYNYARGQVGALLDYDEKRGTDFLRTLQEFLYLRNNVEGTAKSINMSVSGLKYRLSKIEKILGHDLKDYKVCFDLQLALVILQLFGDYRI